MSDDWVNDPYDEAPVHVLDEEGEPDAEADRGLDTDGEGAADASAHTASDAVAPRADASSDDVLTTDD